MLPLAPSVMVCSALSLLTCVLRALHRCIELRLSQLSRSDLENPLSGIDSINGMQKDAKPLMILSYARCVQFSVACAFFGLVWCISTSLGFEFRQSTSTHCPVHNYLPSISAAVGGSQVYMWRFCVAVMTTQRIFDAFAYFQYFQQRRKEACVTSSHLPLLCFCLTFEQLLLLHLFSHLGEQAGLVLLTSVSSRDHFILHAFGFVAFIVCSLIHMQSAMHLHSVCHAPLSPKHKYSLWWKIRLVRANLCCAGIAAVLYSLHNAVCFPGLYSLFALAEYGYVTTNILFNGIGCIDFSDLTLSLS